MLDARDAGIQEICHTRRIHRSVAGGLLISELVRQIADTSVSIHMSATHSWPFMGGTACKGQCAKCMHRTADTADEVAELVTAFVNSVTTKVRESTPTKPL